LLERLLWDLLAEKCSLSCHPTIHNRCTTPQINSAHFNAIAAKQVVTIARTFISK